jgi:uncharacterized protein involved in exopolysaccharide biosynthesis
MNVLAAPYAATGGETDAADKPFDPARLLGMLGRRMRLLITVIVVGMIATLLLAALLPPKYQSAGTILIEQQEVPLDMVRSTVTSYADQRIQVISQRVMTTQTLLGILRRQDLFADEQLTTPREELIDRMKRAISLNMISADVIDPRSGTPREANIAFSISYTSRSPDEAMRVANELTTLYLNENLSSRARLAEDASAFLKAEGDRVSARIAELEDRLATFKQENVQNLPELAAMNMQQLDRTEQDLRASQARLSSLEQQKVYLEAQLVQIKPNSAILSDSGERILSPADRLRAARSQLASATAIYGPEHPDVLRLQREISGLESTGLKVDVDLNELQRQVDAATGELSQLLETRSPEHPDVQRLQREVDTLRATLSEPPPPRSQAAPATSSTPDNPAYIQIRAQLEAAQNDIGATRRLTGQLQAQVLDYRNKINVSPQIEKQYRELLRDYDTARVQYQEIRSKQAEAQVAQNLESDRKGERFTLIEPPIRPIRPVSPNRVLIAILGAILALGLAAGLVLLVDKFDPSVRDGADFMQLVGTVPVALVPLILTVEDQQRGRNRRIWLVAGSVAALAALLTLVHFTLWPLEAIGSALLRRFGI